MTEETSALDLRPEVRAFVERVRSQLADLDLEEQRDLTDGLQADLSDLVAEQGSDALGDPLAYARELRAAAGLEPDLGVVPGRRSIGEATNNLLDESLAWWMKAVSGLPGEPWEVLAALRPAWWVARAWLAVQFIDALFGDGTTYHGISLVPHMRGFGYAVLAVAIFVSAQIGRGRLWSAKGSASGRLVLLVLNGLAVVMIPYLLSSTYLIDNGSYHAGYDQASATPSQPDEVPQGLMSNGTELTNVFAYDAKGRPLTGVQLFDQKGQALSVNTNLIEPDATHITYPWLNGTARLFNVFPLPVGRIDDNTDDHRDPKAYSTLTPPKLPARPFRVAPAVTLPTSAVQLGTLQHRNAR
jgi:hypothetical protein